MSVFDDYRRPTPPPQPIRATKTAPSEPWHPATTDRPVPSPSTSGSQEHPSPPRFPFSSGITAPVSSPGQGQPGQARRLQGDGFTTPRAGLPSGTASTSPMLEFGRQLRAIRDAARPTMSPQEMAAGQTDGSGTMQAPVPAATAYGLPNTSQIDLRGSANAVTAQPVNPPGDWSPPTPNQAAGSPPSGVGQRGDDWQESKP